MNKNEIRQLSLNKRNELNLNEINHKSLAIIDKLDSFIDKFDDILVYYSINGEVSTLRLIDKYITKKRLYFPKVNKDDMDFYLVNDTNKLQKGYMGIFEPLFENMDEFKNSFNKNGLVIVPGVAFDVKGYRTGYGKGFYDRFLSEFNSLTKIGIAYDFQIYDDVYSEAHDVMMDYIITENRILKINE